MDDSESSDAGSRASLFAGTALSHPRDSVGLWFWRAFFAYQRKMEKALEAVELTHLQYAALVGAAWLEEQGGEVSQRDVVRLTGIRESQLSRMVKALCGKGMLTQREGGNDPRVRALSLTEMGWETLRTALALNVEVQNELWPLKDQKETFRETMVTSLERWGELGP